MSKYIQWAKKRFYWFNDKKEADSVLKQHEKKEKSAAYKTGVIIAGLLLIPILITFIVCLSNGGGLNTFAVVTASMLLVAAMTVVPLMAQQKKLTKCIICGVFALLLIFFLLTECIVQMNLCFGLFQLYLDYQLFFSVCHQRNWASTCFIRQKSSYHYAVGYLMAFPHNHWGVWPYKRCCRNEGRLYYSICLCTCSLAHLFDARYLNANGFIKSAIIVLTASVWTAFADDICEFLIFGTRQITIKSVNFSDWTSNICVNANVYAIVLVSGVIISSILL